MAKRLYNLNFENKTDIEKTLDDLLEITSSEASFTTLFEDENTDYTYLFEWRFGLGDFTLVENEESFEEFRAEDGSLYTRHFQSEKNNCLDIRAGEYLFFTKAYAFGLEEKLASLVKQIASLHEYLDTPIITDEETTAGAIPSIILAENNRDYLPLSTALLKQFADPDHECTFNSLADYFLFKYGIDIDTLEYMVTLIACTPSGGEYFAEYCQDEAFANYLKENNLFDNLGRIFERIADELDHDFNYEHLFDFDYEIYEEYEERDEDPNSFLIALKQTLLGEIEDEEDEDDD